MSASLEASVPTSSVATAHYDVVVMGAGPYGLSAAAHLLDQGLNVAIFGKPMELWLEHVPRGMLLRSYWWATDLSDPQKRYTLKNYLNKVRDLPTFDPVPGQMVAEYGLWFQKQAVPNVDETFIQNIEKEGDLFKVTLVDGRMVTAPSVIMAPGLQPYVYRAPEYNHLPKELVSHTAETCTFNHLAGKHVAIIGGGQSALESSALAFESGVKIELISRKPVEWITDPANFPEYRPIWQVITYPKAGVGPGWFNKLEETFPYGFQALSRQTKDRLLNGSGAHGPKGSAWLRPRLVGNVPMHQGTSVVKAEEKDGGVLLTLSNQKSIHFDQLILATGYRVDLSRLGVLGESLLPNITAYHGAPELSSYFESSVPGLYFIGYSAHKSMGPCYRFVVGTGAAARRVTAAIARKARVSR